MSNLICTSILPGPKEQNPDQIQCFLWPIISDLLCLWKHGIVIPTESFPQDRLVHIILVAVVCDKPAAHKIGSFVSYSHTNFCTVWWISIKDKDKPKAFEKGAFQPRTNEEQCELGEQYRQLTLPTAHKIFVKEFATQYTQLTQSLYFDLVNLVTYYLSMLHFSRPCEDSFLQHMGLKQNPPTRP
ncbi:hypothetical protein PAXRUDRAFT_36514 [Paxillus rubicundulus Ve08.2h10]|uniref:Uncharacterized protein n=1 Tax=Paxillus rubicundulus Ve08.2h10 TaxID=930991 RepID=A0A0D0DE51_9AGAM|nr:hypothetical protein PAXRUDRAFT_36514 [Paxillus rubicundulus Ve08.2h10]